MGGVFFLLKTPSTFYCLSAGLDGSWFVALAYSSGHYINYDGSMYEFNGVGEYLLLKQFTDSSNREEILVNILQVRYRT